ncbi:rap1 GTPase-GDP dissociation stimulator 1-like isoform X1 [Tachypleus tridentatus]|uniref:rap1 GTPase-GDP dissociation stimulator 1-like isoform X1 n=1 Tax=Tachypleus tridentatus TaxID=6853 RepID=UPI003FD50F61
MDLTKHLEALKLFLQEDPSISEAKVEECLDVITQTVTSNSKESSLKALVEKLLNEGLAELVIDLLRLPTKLSSIQLTKLLELMAEVAKCELARKSLSDPTVVSTLLELLSSKDNQVVLQSCRALGNVCFDNDLARGIVKDHKGVEKLVDLLKSLLEMKEMPHNLQATASGCLLNMTETCDETQEQALKAGITDVLLQYLSRYHSDEDVASHCLLVLNCLADYDIGRETLVERTSLSYLLEILDKNLTSEVLETLLELFGNLLENDNVKLQLAELGFCERLLALMKKCQDGDYNEESHNILKTLCDLTVLILTGDDSMEKLYGGRTTEVYKQTMNWICSNDENLQIGGALAAGNFARKDEHCIQMMKDHVPKDLIELLKKHCGKDGDIRLQHAVLSALKNLAIPMENKAVLVELGVVDHLLKMTEVETYPVVFKLLGTLRMLVDKQDNVARRIGVDSTFIQQLVKWGYTEDHPGVRGEAVRLLAWLVKHSRSSDVMQLIVKEGGVPQLVNMIQSEHHIMQNEALLALIIMADTMLGEVTKDFQKSGLSSVVNVQLQQDRLSSETLQNMLTLVASVVSAETLKPEFQELGIKSELSRLSESTDKEVCERAKICLNLLYPTP